LKDVIVYQLKLLKHIFCYIRSCTLYSIHWLQNNSLIGCIINLYIVTLSMLHCYTQRVVLLHPVCCIVTPSLLYCYTQCVVLLHPVCCVVTPSVLRCYSKEFDFLFMWSRNPEVTYWKCLRVISSSLTLAL